VPWEHRPGEATLSASKEVSFNGPVASLHRAVLLCVAESGEGADVMKIEIKRPRPRNPLIAPARLRRAGSHRPSGRTERQCAARRLRRQLDELKPIP
jgi:hypothetical protein